VAADGVERGDLAVGDDSEWRDHESQGRS
jgi:hypothetical protein